jgi:hypothetical protein
LPINLLLQTLVVRRAGGIEPLSEAAQTEDRVQRAQRVPHFVGYEEEVSQVDIGFSAIGALQRSH